MSFSRTIPIPKDGIMKTYILKAVVEPDDDRWAAHCPALLRKGASTWGNTPAEALKNLQDVVRMVLESLVEHGEDLPEGPTSEVHVSEEPQVAVTI